jgi:hypothetical protein
MTRHGCPFCGHIHIRIVRKQVKAYAECLRCFARGPLAKKPEAAFVGFSIATEAFALWDERTAP